MPQLGPQDSLAKPQRSPSSGRPPALPHPTPPDSSRLKSPPKTPHSRPGLSLTRVQGWLSPSHMGQSAPSRLASWGMSAASLQRPHSSHLLPSSPPSRAMVQVTPGWSLPRKLPSCAMVQVIPGRSLPRKWHRVQPQPQTHCPPCAFLPLTQPFLARSQPWNTHPTPHTGHTEPLPPCIKGAGHLPQTGPLVALGLKPRSDLRPSCPLPQRHCLWEPSTILHQQRAAA